MLARRVMFIVSLITLSCCSIARAENYDRICQYNSPDSADKSTVVTEACSLKGAASNEMPYFGTYKTRSRAFVVKRSGSYDFNSDSHKATLNGETGQLTENTSYNFRMRTNSGKVFNAFASLSQNPKDTPFRGIWTLDLTQGCKRVDGEYPDDTIIFEAKGIKGYEYTCNIKSHGRPLDDERGTLFVVADCQGEGEKWREVYDFQFRDDKTATIKNMPYHKCTK